MIVATTIKGSFLFVYHRIMPFLTDVAAYLIEETDTLGEVPTPLQNYIDYEAFGRDLEIEGNFICTNHGIFEYIE